MDYFVTGATGFIGKRLVKKLLARPDSTVHFLTRSKDPEKLEALYAFWGVDKSRAIPVIGDLKEKQLGVSKAEQKKPCVGMNRPSKRAKVHPHACNGARHMSGPWWT